MPLLIFGSQNFNYQMRKIVILRSIKEKYKEYIQNERFVCIY